MSTVNYLGKWRTPPRANVHTPGASASFRTITHYPSAAGGLPAPGAVAITAREAHRLQELAANEARLLEKELNEE